VTARVAMIDGALVAPEAAKVSAYDRGFLYGDLVFEVMRVYAGAPFARDEHLARVARSAALVHLSMPASPAQLADELTRALKAAAAGDAYVRVSVSRGEGPPGLDLTRATAPRRVIMVEPLPALPEALYARGIAAVTATTTRATEGTSAAAAKFGGYLANALALHDARARGADDAILVDAAGRVLEATAANVFAVRGGELLTPDVASGVLPGITRAAVLRLARPLRTVEAPLDVGALRAAHEVFLTSSIRELVPVVRIDGAAVGAGVPGPVTRRLHAELRALAARPA